MATLGIICGMETEADALGPIREHARVLIGISGGRPDRAERAARRFLSEGCTALLSWGVAGALHPDLRPGTLIVPAEVETVAGMRYPLARDRVGAQGAGGLVLGFDQMVLRADDKAALHRITGAQIVDMESHRVARIGFESATPVVTIRAVADPAERSLPGFVADALTETGEPRLGVVLAGLARRPRALHDLLDLRRDTRAALATLEAVAESGALARLLA
jgi:adenosylhomocysteine nucleosidase